MNRLWFTARVRDGKYWNQHTRRIKRSTQNSVGTPDEATDVLELRKHILYDEPAVLLNTAGFHDGLILQLRRMDEQGFLPLPRGELLPVEHGRGPRSPGTHGPGTSLRRWPPPL